MNGGNENEAFKVSPRVNATKGFVSSNNKNWNGVSLQCIFSHLGLINPVLISVFLLSLVKIWNEAEF